MTVEPYAVAKNLPFDLVASFELSASNSSQLTSDFFFNGGKFSNQTVLLGWSYAQIAPIVNSLISSYSQRRRQPATAPAWPGDDYDTIWTVTLDAEGNLTVNNAMCEGIDSAALPVTCPQF